MIIQGNFKSCFHSVIDLVQVLLRYLNYNVSTLKENALEII